MNKRIKQLAEQALVVVANERVLADGQLERTWHPDYFNQVFAELIVKECADIAKQTDADDGDDYKSGRTWAGIEILKHFNVGVKE